MQFVGEQSDRGRTRGTGYADHSETRMSGFCHGASSCRAFCFPRVILGLYTNIPDLIESSVPSLWVYCTTLLLIVPGNVYFQAVSGTGNTRTAFLLEAVTLVVYTLYIYITISLLRLDVAWCWTSEHVYGFCILLCCYIYMKRGRWKAVG